MQIIIIVTVKKNITIIIIMTKGELAVCSSNIIRYNT